MTRNGRVWVAIDVGFWDHPDVEDAGEPAGVLFLRLLAWAKVHETDGVVPLRQPRAWHDDFQLRLDALVKVGLVEVDDRRIRIVDWPKWHRPVSERKTREQEQRIAARDRMRRIRADRREPTGMAALMQVLAEDPEREMSQ